MEPPFFLVGNELIYAFLPIMGCECLGVYSYFVCRSYLDPTLKHSVRKLATATHLSVTTVSRVLGILEYLGLIALTRFPGSKDSECQLLNCREAVFRLGAEYDSKSLSFSWPPAIAANLRSQIEALREEQQGNSSQGASQPCGNLQSVSQRNASISPVERQRATRETQTGLHLLREDERIGRILTPTSFQGEAEKTKAFPDEGGTVDDLKWARVRFDGFMHDLKDHLFAPRPQFRHLTQGSDDWETYSFDSLAVKRVSWNGATLVLVLSARDPAAVWRGRDKYRRKWDEVLERWFGCEVYLEIEPGEG